ncbi:hypothetical protein AB1N83_007200 [Pleurotus pulmonarius]
MNDSHDDMKATRTPDCSTDHPSSIGVLSVAVCAPMNTFRPSVLHLHPNIGLNALRSILTEHWPLNTGRSRVECVSTRPHCFAEVSEMTSHHSRLLIWSFFERHTWRTRKRPRSPKQRIITVWLQANGQTDDATKRHTFPAHWDM